MKSILLSLAMLLIFTSCGSDNQTSSSETSSKAELKYSKSCFAEDAPNPCGIISLEEITSIVSNGKEITMAEPPAAIKNPKMRYCFYRWDGGRSQTVTVMKKSMTAPKEDQIGIGGIHVLTKEQLEKSKRTAVEEFNRYHKNMTVEDQQKFDEIVDEELEKNEEVDKKSAKNMAKSLSKYHYTDVNDFDELAKWRKWKDNTGGSLFVLHHNAIIEIQVDISDDDGPNIEMAKKVWDELRKKC